ncbi:MAG: PTS sugar transporter subunit IIC [Bacillota bacterium]
MAKSWEWVLENRIMPPLVKAAQQRHMRAIRDGFFALLPVIISGALFLLIAYPPVKALDAMVAPVRSKLLIPTSLTFDMLALYVSFFIGFNLARTYDLNPITGGIVALLSFLASVGTKSVDGVGTVLPLDYLGGRGIFGAVLLSLLAVEVIRLMKKYGLTFRFPDSVPPYVAEGFNALLPAMLMVTVVTLLTTWIGFNPHALLGKVLAPLVVAGDSLWVVLITTILWGLLVGVGIHAASVIYGVMAPIWLTAIAQNIDAVKAGAHIVPHIVNEPFFFNFVFLGGAGSTLPLVLLLLRSRSKQFQTIAKVALVPNIFNINEPIEFGLPIVMNPLMIIPFTLAPVADALLAYFAMYFNLVPRPYLVMPWTMPPVLGAYLSTGGSLSAALLAVVGLVVAGAIYYPFIKMAERKASDFADQGDASAAA